MEELNPLKTSNSPLSSVSKENFKFAISAKYVSSPIKVLNISFQIIIVAYTSAILCQPLSFVNTFKYMQDLGTKNFLS